MLVSPLVKHLAWFLLAHPMTLLAIAAEQDGHRRGVARGAMSASGGEKRRRRRERRFLAFHDLLSMRASTAAIVATFGFVVLQIARTF
jgi:hypothetical protein